MSDDEELVGGRLNVRQGLLVLGVLKWLERRQDPDRPEMVPGGPKVTAVLRRAGELARENRQDSDAVASIRAAAAGSRRTLEQAARASRFDGLHHELRDQNFVFRLIEAARAGTPVAAVSEDDRGRIDAVEAMMALSQAERWELLCQREPRLAGIEQDVRSGRFGRVRPTPRGQRVDTGRRSVGADGRERIVFRSERGPHSEQERRELAETAHNSSALNRRLSQLLGPASGHDDALLQTKRAQQTALAHLISISDGLSRE